MGIEERENHYFDKIPIWNSRSPGFSITADSINGRIPVVRLEDWRDFSDLLESEFFNRPGIQLIFRGHRRYNWNLSPTLGRIATNGIVSRELLTHSQRARNPVIADFVAHFFRIMSHKIPIPSPGRRLRLTCELL